MTYVISSGAVEVREPDFLVSALTPNYRDIAERLVKDTYVDDDGKVILWRSGQAFLLDADPGVGRRRKSLMLHEVLGDCFRFLSRRAFTLRGRSNDLVRWNPNAGHCRNVVFALHAIVRHIPHTKAEDWIMDGPVVAV